jgi:hypothetical protein
MLEARADHPSRRGTIPVVAGVVLELDSGREIVSIIDQRISPPAVAIPKERPWIADPQRTLSIAAHAHLETPGLIRLDVYGSADSLSFEEVPVIALQEEGGPARLAAGKRLILKRIDLAVESAADAVLGPSLNPEVEPGDVAEVAAVVAASRSAENAAQVDPAVCATRGTELEQGTKQKWQALDPVVGPARAQ